MDWDGKGYPYKVIDYQNFEGGFIQITRFLLCNITFILFPTTE